MCLQIKKEPLLGDWEIVSINNEIYGVYNNETNKLLHVSKYMIAPFEHSHPSI